MSLLSGAHPGTSQDQSSEGASVEDEGALVEDEIPELPLQVTERQVKGVDSLSGSILGQTVQ